MSKKRQRLIDRLEEECGLLLEGLTPQTSHDERFKRVGQVVRALSTIARHEGLMAASEGSENEQSES